MATATKDEKTDIVKRLKKEAVSVEPDSDRYKCRFIIRGSSGINYMISFDTAPAAGYWKCACRGCIRHGQCKHLTACGLQGRKFGKSFDNRKWAGHFG